MPRYKLLLEYDGSAFVGWQHQENGFSVQQALEDAILNFSGEKVRVFAAGRTDAGVHALGQVAHVDLASAPAPGRVRDAINAHVRPAPVSVLCVEAVPDAFDARHSASARVYLYRISNRRAPLSLDRGRLWHVPIALNADAMQEAAKPLIGEHDFTSFRASVCQANSPVKTLDRLTVERIGDEICITVQARSFLQHQVRNMVGTLKLVGEDKWTRGDVSRALDACDRAASGPTAPPEGLYLVEVVY